MAVDYEQWQKAGGWEAKQSIVLEAKNRLADSVKAGSSITDIPRFTHDTYLLDQTGYLTHVEPDLLQRARVAAGDPRVIRGFLDNLRTQDTTASSLEVLASIHVARRVDYDQTANLKQVFDTLEIKHVALLEEAERLRQEEKARVAAEEAARQREQARQQKQAEAEAKKQAETVWFAREPLTGKSPEWVDAQTHIERVWHEKSRNLPKGRARNSRTADMQYLVAGFDLLHEEILRGGIDSVRLRAMIEWLIPEIWRQPILVLEDLIEMEQVLNNKRKPYEKAVRAHEEAVRQAQQKGEPEPPAPATPPLSHLKDLPPIQKILLVPASLRKQDATANPDQKWQVRSIYATYNKALHQDIKKDHPDIDKRLLPHTDQLHKSINKAWNRGKEF